MKNFLIILLLFFINTVISQTKEKINTLYVSNTQNVLIFFDSPIIQGICGHSNFKFAFNLEEENKYGIIRGVKGKKSNLHIITKNGNVYSFKLEYKDVITKHNYFINVINAVGNIDGDIVQPKKNNIKVDLIENLNNNKPEKEEIINYSSKSDTITNYKKEEKDESDIMYNTNRQEFYKKYCSNIFSKKANLKRYYIENNDVILYLEDIKFNRNELYFKFLIVNNSAIDYDINFLSFSKTARKKRKKSSSQSIDVPFIYTYNNFVSIPSGEKEKAVYVFKKFGINKEKSFVFELNESKGERNIIFEILPQIINNPF